ncbi:hypothetical protein EYF80_042693 [Liparis tanakae]|uniref:Uncharacterized protein n=1 Tax=Liparis tanakae TaxID=230148 RepID=A0A4Z2G0T7_9TELE|nr:hypothetical protein EYF80_042693 [Liparis tanakae]
MPGGEDGEEQASLSSRLLKVYRLPGEDVETSSANSPGDADRPLSSASSTEAYVKRSFSALPEDVVVLEEPGSTALPPEPLSAHG